MTSLLRGGMLLLFAASTMAAGLPANEWVPVNSGEIELGPFYPNLIGCKLVYAAHSDKLIVIPQFGQDETGLRLMSMSEPVWTSVKGTAPDNLIPERGGHQKSYCYLEGLKKILLLKERWSYSRNKTPVGSWLIDVDAGDWQPIAGGLMMSHKSADYEPAAGRDGAATPRWGNLCYDAYNAEAVSFGGGGVWGRVDREPSAASPGQWIYDDNEKRCRRLPYANEQKVTTARRWFPSHCGTWVFPETTQEWAPIEQPLHQQPSGRILPGMAYDSNEKKIVLFGGDDYAHCFGDTWIYDCTTRSWKEVNPPISPRARAGHAMVYVPDQKVILMAAGYAGGWQPLGDVWTYSIADNKWTCLGTCAADSKETNVTGLGLPYTMAYASGVYLPERKTVALAAYRNATRNKSVPVYELRLDRATVAGAAPPAVAVELDYHCRAGRLVTDLPGNWLTGKGTPEQETDVRARLNALPANVWHNMNPAKSVPERNWGSYIYDIRSHKAFAWGGGHSCYPGAEISTYDLLTNRWRGMAEPTNYNPVWLHGMVGGPPGLSFGGWSLLPSHARKSYGVDPLSNSIVTYSGDVFSIPDRSVTRHIGAFPIDWGGPSHQVAYVTAPHGLYAYARGTSSTAKGCLAKANVAAGTWDVVATGGPPKHQEHDFLCYDSKRDRLLHMQSTPPEIWSFDFASKSWAQEPPAGPTPVKVLGEATYIPELDAVLTVYAVDKKSEEKLVLYGCRDKRWYTAPSTGYSFRSKNTSGRDYSPIYDPELGIVIRITPTGFHQWLDVHVMRLDAKALTLQPMGS